MSEKDNNIQEIDVEKVISSKNKNLLKIIPGFIIRYLKRVIHQDQLNEYLRENKDADAYEFFENGVKMFGTHVVIKGKENLPENKRAIFASNHPLGGLDGGVFIKVIHDIYGELRFPVNDILLNIPNTREIFLPVNKHGGQTREALQAIDDAYASDLPILYFPAGLCSRKVNGKIVDLEWKKNFITQAKKHKRDIVPVHIDGRNSNFFYNLSNLRKKLGIKANIEMLYLVDEMYQQYDKNITISFGKPIPWKTLDKSKSVKEWVAYIRNKCYEMAPGG